MADHLCSTQLALGMLKGVLCQAGSGWSMQERFVQNAVKLRAKCNSFFVKKATVYVCVCVYLCMYVCDISMATHYQWTNTDDPPDAGRTNLFQELLTVAGLILHRHTTDWNGEAATLHSLHSVVERTLTALIPSVSVPCTWWSMFVNIR